MIAITGGTSPLARHFRRFNHDLEIVDLLNREKTPYRLGDDVDTQQLSKCTHLIHFAWTHGRRHEHAKNPNLTSVNTLASESAKCRVKFIFLSSLAAYQPWNSQYGSDKLAAEQKVASLGGVSIRPALVWGLTETSRFSTFQNTLRKIPVDFKLDGEVVSLHLVHADDIAGVLRTIVSDLVSNDFLSSHGGVLDLFSPRLVTLSEISGRRKLLKLSLNFNSASLAKTHNLLKRSGLSFRKWEQLMNVLVGSRIRPTNSGLVFRDLT